MDLHLKNHTVVITGGASGIGLAVAKLFTEEGSLVHIWDLRKPDEGDFSFELVDITDHQNVVSATER